MTYQIVPNIEVPASAATRNRARGEFAQAVDGLEVGEGFFFDDTAAIKLIYPRVGPKKFGGRRFKVWQQSVNEDGSFKYGVKRVDGGKRADAAVATVGTDEDAGE